MVGGIKTFFKCNQDLLKIWALIAMTADHVSKYFFHDAQSVWIMAGRMAFPIFAFLMMMHLAGGGVFKKYIVRLSLFAAISTAVLWPFPWFLRDNILWAFLLPIIVISLIQWVRRQEWSDGFITGVLSAAVVLGGLLLAGFLSYGVMGYALMLALYAWFKSPSRVFYALVLLTAFLINFDGTDFGLIGGLVSLATVFVLMHWDRKKKYPRILKKWWGFYVYYPAHLLIIFMLDIFV